MNLSANAGVYCGFNLSGHVYFTYFCFIAIQYFIFTEKIFSQIFWTFGFNLLTLTSTWDFCRCFGKSSLIHTFVCLNFCMTINFLIKKKKLNSFCHLSFAYSLGFPSELVSHGGAYVLALFLIMFYASLRVGFPFSFDLPFFSAYWGICFCGSS